MNRTARSLSFPKLDGLQPTLESTALKLMEEAGELAQAIGKLRGLSGEKAVLSEADALEKVGSELLDVAQTAATMMYVLEEQHGVAISELLSHHETKLRSKGYLS